MLSNVWASANCSDNKKKRAIFLVAHSMHEQRMCKFQVIDRSTGWWHCVRSRNTHGLAFHARECLSTMPTWNEEFISWNEHVQKTEEPHLRFPLNVHRSNPILLCSAFCLQKHQRLRALHIFDSVLHVKGKTTTLRNTTRGKRNQNKCYKLQKIHY